MKVYVAASIGAMPGPMEVCGCLRIHPAGETSKAIMPDTYIRTFTSREEMVADAAERAGKIWDRCVEAWGDRPEAELPAWVRGLYALAADQTDSAVDHVYANVDLLCKRGRFRELDLVLENLDFSKLEKFKDSACILHALLISTYPAQDYLPNRSRILDKLNG